MAEKFKFDKSKIEQISKFDDQLLAAVVKEQLSPELAQVHKREKDVSTVEKLVALQVEWTEAYNETCNHKWWKNMTPKNKENLIYEVADAWIFMIILFPSDCEGTIERLKEMIKANKEVVEQIESKNLISLEGLYSRFLYNISNLINAEGVCDYNKLINEEMDCEYNDLMKLISVHIAITTYMLLIADASFNDLFKAIQEKTKVNVERQKKGAN